MAGFPLCAYQVPHQYTVPNKLESQWTNLNFSDLPGLAPLLPASWAECLRAHPECCRVGGCASIVLASSAASSLAPFVTHLCVQSFDVSAESGPIRTLGSGPPSPWESHKFIWACGGIWAGLQWRNWMFFVNIFWFLDCSKDMYLPP